MPDTRGSTVPHRTTATTPSRSRFWRTKAPSRETGGVGLCGADAPRRSERNASSATENSRHRPRNAKNQGPMALIANVCTEGTTPLRTMNVPNTTSRKARMTRPKFQARMRPRFSWTWDECRYAVVASHGIKATTAYLHSSQVQEKRGRMRAWNFGLVILAFLLVVFGTFIVRSGVVPSVHTFAISAIGPWFFAFLGLCLLFSVALLAFRSERLGASAPHNPTPPVSREGAFVLQNLLLLGVVAVVLWGTVLPLVSGMFGGQRVVGAPY